MNTSYPQKWKIAAGLACTALLGFVNSSQAFLQVTGAYQNPGGTFTPTWAVAPNSLIAGMLPSTSAGNFSAENAGGNLSILTDGVLPQQTSGANSFPQEVAGGSAAGTELIYTLPAASHGYDLTNISVYSGWANGGRSAQDYTVFYSTVENPSSFIFLTNVSYTAGFSGNQPGSPIALQVAVTDSAGGTIAANVAAVEFYFPIPTSSDENSGSGYTEITIQGNPSAAAVPPPFYVSESTQLASFGSSSSTPFNPTWTIETPNLIAGETIESGGIVATGNYSEETTGRSPDSLTDGATNALSMLLVENSAGNGNTTSTNYVTCGGNGCTSLTFQLPSSQNGGFGSDLTNIVTYSGWEDNGRDGQYYTVSYSTVSAPTTFIPITTVLFLPSVAGGTPVANRIAISENGVAPIAQSVAYVKFTFNPLSAGSFNNGYQGYAQIILQGINSAPPTAPPSPYLVQDSLPALEIAVVGDSLTLSAAFSNSPPAVLQWQQVVNGVTNNVGSPVTTPGTLGDTTNTLFISGLTTNNSGVYQLQAVNATNHVGGGYSYSTGVPVTVNPLPAATNGLIITEANQLGWPGGTGISTNFYPTWTIDTNADLIYGYTEEAGDVTDGGGNWNEANLLSLDAYTNALPDLLTDGKIGYITYWPGVGDSPTEVTAGGANEGGISVTYTLPSSASLGWDLTNVTVYGGWGDSGRDQQEYQVSYATYLNPSTFIPLPTVSYLPANPNGVPSATRTEMIPASGALAHNVAYVLVNFFFQGNQAENGWEGYSEISLGGHPSLPVPVLTQDINVLTAEDVIGSQIILTATFSGANSYQWFQNGVAVPGATSSTLNLSPLTANMTGSYYLAAYNSSGSNVSSSTAVKVDPMPAATNNIVTAWAYQTSHYSTFGPTWDTSSLSASLIYGAYPVAEGNGNFQDPDTDPLSNDQAGGLPVLTDGNYGQMNPNGPHPAFATCGPNAGQFVEYSLPDANAYGDNISKLEIAGGWNDNGRDAQYYTISYSTIENPTNFIPLVEVANNPAVPNNTESVLRATFTPVSGLLASNVAAIYVDFTVPPGVPNGYSGYSEISVFGTAATSYPPPQVTTNLTPLLSDVPVGTALNYSVAGSGGSASVAYQWFLNGAPISGATNTTYSFAALAGTNGYSVAVSNQYGATFSSTASVVGETTPPPVLIIGGGSNWSFNAGSGSASVATLTASNQIELTFGLGGEANSAFYNAAQYVGGFVGSFWYQDHGGGGADGATFTLQNSPTGVTAVGAGGGGLGYLGISPSVAIELDVYSGSVGAPGIDIAVDGTNAGPYSSTGPINIASGDWIYVQMYYQNDNLELTFIDPSAGTFTTNVAIDILGTIGNGSAYVGFTGADGGISSFEYISDFIFSYTTAPTLAITPSTGGKAIVSVPVTVSPLFQLMQSTNLTGPWVPASTVSSVVVGSQVQTTVSTTNNADAFFELQLKTPFGPAQVP